MDTSEKGLGHDQGEKTNGGTDDQELTSPLDKTKRQLQDVPIDEIYVFLGKYGRYQMFQLLLQCIAYIGGAFPILHGMFVGKYVNFHCSMGDGIGSNLTANQSVHLSECHVQVKDYVTSRVLQQETCTNHEFEGGDTFVSYIAEWNLICDKEVLGQLPQILLIVGQGIGSVLISPFADRFGRRKVAIANVFGLFVTMFLSAFVRHFELLLILRVFMGALLQGEGITCGTMTLEIVHTDLRAAMTAVLTFVWVAGVMATGLIGYLLQDADWRTMQLTYALVGGVIMIVPLLFIDESLMWLIGNTRNKRAAAILKKACRWNNKDYDMLMDKIALDEEKDDPQSEPKKELMVEDKTDTVTDTDTAQSQPEDNGAEIGIIEVVRNKHLRIITFVSCFTWLVTALSYYGILLMSTTLAGDPYINFFLTSLVEIPGTFMIYFMLKHVNRKPMLIGLSLASAISLFLAVTVANAAPSNHSYRILQTCLTLLGQFFIIQIFTSIYLYTPELYPTNLRNVGLGISSFAARIGSSFSPLFTILARKIPWAPGAMIGGGCLISALLLTLLPETRNVPLPATLQDVDDMSKNKKDKARGNCSTINGKLQNNIDEHKHGGPPEKV